MGINLGQIGAFAGGLGKGYLAADDMEQTRKRTAVLEREAALREESNKRAGEQHEWQRREQERKAAYEGELATTMAQFKDKLVLGEDGQPDFTLPQNRRVLQAMQGAGLRVGMNHGVLKSEDMLRYQQVLDKIDQDEADKAVAAYVASGDPKHLTPVLKRAAPDVDLDGAKRSTKKNRNGHEEDGVILKDGSFVPDTYLYGVMRQDKLLDAISKRTTAETQQATAAEQARHNKAVEARMASAEKRAEEQAKVSEFLETRKYIKSAVYKQTKDANGATVDADPLYNSTAEQMVQDRLSTFEPDKKGAARAAVAADGIVAEVKRSLDEVDARVKAAAAANKVTDRKAIEAARRAAYRNFVANGYQLPPLPQERPPSSLSPQQAQEQVNQIPTGAPRAAALSPVDQIPR